MLALENLELERRFAVLQYHVWRARVSVQCSSNDSSRHGVGGCV